MTAGFDPVQMLRAWRGFVERLRFTERRVIVVSCIQKNDRSLLQLLQILMYIKNFLMRRAVRDIDDRITGLPRELAIHWQTDRENSANRNRKLRFSRDDHAVAGAEGPASENNRRFNINAGTRERDSCERVVVARA